MVRNWLICLLSISFALFTCCNDALASFISGDINIIIENHTGNSLQIYAPMINAPWEWTDENLWSETLNPTWVTSNEAGGRGLRCNDDPAGIPDAKASVQITVNGSVMTLNIENMINCYGIPLKQLAEIVPTSNVCSIVEKYFDREHGEYNVKVICK